MSYPPLTDPDNPRRTWTHPCKCTLVAHESCLLQWIQTSQGNASRAPNALKCPQCASTYELESDNPIILRILSSGNKSLQMMGRLFTVFSVSTVVAIFGTGESTESTRLSQRLNRPYRDLYHQYRLWSICSTRISWEGVSPAMSILRSLTHFSSWLECTTCC
jgi:hypothetical protein